MFSGFGNVPAASWRGQRGRAMPGDYAAVFGPSLQSSVMEKQRRAAARFFSSSMPIESVQAYRGGEPSSVVSTFQAPGLGNIAPSYVDPTCADVAPLVEQLTMLIRARGMDMNPGIKVAAEQLAASGSTDCKARVDELQQIYTAAINDLRSRANAAPKDTHGNLIPTPGMTDLYDESNFTPETPTAPGLKLPQIPGLTPDVSKYVLIGGAVLAGVLLFGGVAFITGKK